MKLRRREVWGHKHTHTRTGRGEGDSPPVYGDCDVSTTGRRVAAERINFPPAVFLRVCSSRSLKKKNKLKEAGGGGGGGAEKGTTHIRTEKTGYYGYSSLELRVKARVFSSQPPGCRSEEGSRGLGASPRRTCSPPSRSASPPTGRST